MLVSVRDLSELEIAVSDSGIDIVDLKEPRRGPLAPADPGLWRRAAELWETDQSAYGIGDRCLSAALGERADAITLVDQVPPKFAFVKVGPSGCQTADGARDLWRTIRRGLGVTHELVAVAYADWCTARCPDAETLFHLAHAEGFRRILVDTYGKDGRSTMDHLGIAGLRRLDEIARRCGLWWTLAGSIKADCIETLARAGVRPDCFGVRGDVCRDGRSGELCRKRIEVWKDCLARVADGFTATESVTRPNQVRSSS